MSIILSTSQVVKKVKVNSILNGNIQKLKQHCIVLNGTLSLITINSLIWHHPIVTPRKENTVAKEHGRSQARMRSFLTIAVIGDSPFCTHLPPIPPTLI